MLFRSLQDRGGEVDRVGARAVVRVDRLRGHVPLVAVGGLADLVEVVALVEGIGREHVGEVVAGHDLQAVPRSEEHTSELQSLMRISYAVFCLKKKNKLKQKQYLV